MDFSRNDVQEIVNWQVICRDRVYFLTPSKNCNF